MREREVEQQCVFHSFILCVIGVRVIVPRNMAEASNLSYSVTFVTSLRSDRGGHIISTREGSNDAWDFFDSVLDAVENGIFSPGAFLVLDNARIHHARAIADLLEEILRGVGITLIFLPPYTPEFNPCEFVFQKVKQHIRLHRGNGTLLQEMLVGFDRAITHERVLEDYLHCIP
jgi:hypothetical protein